MLPVIIIIYLLISAVVILHAKNNAAVKRRSLEAHVLAFAASIALLVMVGADGTISLAIGQEPWNFHMTVTPMSAFMVSLFTGVGLLVVWASFSMIEYDVEEQRIAMYYALVCVLIAALCGVVMFGNLFNIFLLMEISSFAAAGLVIIRNRPENMRAGLKYLTLSILGSGFILMGIIIFYTLTGALTHSYINAGLLENITGREYYLRNALVFITVGTALKSGLFPMHIWVPDAYGEAPNASSALLSGLVQKAYIYVYIMILYKAIGADILFSYSGTSSVLFVLMVVSAMAMLAGSFMALLQSDIKRMIAYSSVAQVGYFFLGIGLGSQIGLFAVFFHFLAHAITKAMLFLAAGSVIQTTNNRELEKLGGIGTKMRVTMAIFTLGSLSMVGIPLLIGFNSKWFFAMGIMDSSHIWLLVVLGISSLLNGCYYLPVAVRAFLGKPDEADTTLPAERPVRHLAPIICMATLVVALAVFGGAVNAYIEMGVGYIW
ncbi:MAG: hypothetical protein FWD96_01240 [Defluviitaleaceae bacterium]|nr:hypothetical protein [Defluviitaleaceae bacterium]